MPTLADELNKLGDELNNLLYSIKGTLIMVCPYCGASLEGEIKWMRLLKLLDEMRAKIAKLGN